MSNVTETNVELEADGTPVFAALDSAKRRISDIQKAILEIVKTAESGTKTFDQKIAQQVSNLQKALGQMQSLAKFAEDGGYGKGSVRNTNAEQSMARATVKAAEFRKTVEQASNAIDAMNARLNKVDQKFARFGNMGVTSGPAFEKLEAQRKSLLAQLDLYKRIGEQQEALDRKVSRTKGVKLEDFAVERERLANAKAALEAKIMNPKSRDVTKENAQTLEALKAYETALTSARTKRADMLALARQEAAADREKAKQMSDYDRAMLVREKEKADQMKAMWAQQDAQAKKEDQRVAEMTARQLKAHEARLAQEAELRRLDEQRAQQALANAERLRKIDLQYQKSQVPNQTASAVAGGTGEALKADMVRRVLAAKEAYLNANEKDKAQTLDLLRLEQARLAEITKQLKAKQREEAAGASEGGGILPKGGFGTVIARTAAYAAAGSGIFAVVAALQQGLSFALEFEDALDKLQAVAGATDRQMVGLTESIIEVGQKSRFSLNELAEAATTLAQAGFSTGDIKNSLMSVQTLAAASGSTLTQSVDLTTSAISAFSLSTADATRVADGLVSALNRSKLTVGDVASAIQTAGSTAASNNMTFEELTATIGSMTQAGVRGQMASTGLRQFLIDLKNPSKDLSEELTKLGLKFEDVDVSTRGLPAVLETLQSRGFGASEAFASLENRSAAAYLTMVRQLPLQRELSEAMNDTGVAAAAAGKATQSFAAQWQEFKNNLGAGGFSIVEMLGLDDGVRKLNELADRARFLEQYRKDHNIDPSDFGDTTAIAAADAYIKAKHALDGYNESLDAASTKTKTAEEAMFSQQQKIDALDGAIARIVARQGSLKDNSADLAIETGNMSRQFEGLSLHLDVAKNSFENLLRAAQAYRTEQLQILQDQANLAAAANREQAEVQRRGASATVNRIDQLGGKNLPADVKELIDRATHSASRGDDYNTRMNVLNQLRDKAGTLADPQLKQAILDLVAQLRGMSASQRMSQREALTGDAARIAQRSDWVEQFNKASALTNSEKDRPQVLSMIDKLNTNMAGYSQATRQVAQQLLGILQGKLTAPGTLRTDSNTSQTARAERSATDSAYMKKVLLEAMPGARVTATKDDHAKYVAGTKRVSDHFLDRAIDFVPAGGMGAMNKDEMRQFLENLGIKIRRNAQGVEQLFGPGDKGHNDHWHFAWEGSAPSVDKLYQADTSNSQLAVTTADRDLKDKIRERNMATSVQVFDEQNKSVLKSLDAWEEAYRKLNDDQMRTFTPAQKALRLAEVEEAVRAKREEIQTKTVDGVLAIVNKAFEAINKAFDRQFQAYDLEISKLQGELDGFNLPSNEGRVPDYVKTLTQQRLDRATEGRQRAVYDALPSKISQTQSQIDAINGSTSLGNMSETELAAAQAKVLELTDSLHALEEQRLHLEAVFGAQGLIPKSFAEGFDQAIASVKGASDFGLNFTQQMTMGLGGAISEVRNQFTGFFTDVMNGSQSVLGAFGNMAKGIIKYIEEMAAKAVAAQIFDFLISLVPSFSGSKGVSAASGNTFAGPTLGWMGHYTGGLIKGYASGGHVTAGTSARDSVITKLSKGEFVVQKSAVDSVGHSFMENLNRKGSQALAGMKAGPTLAIPQARQDMKVFVVAPDSKPSMSPSDVLLVIQEDMLKGGTTKQLVKHISQGG